LQQAFRRAGIEPGEAPAETFELELSRTHVVVRRTRVTAPKIS
jgi:hypothetical protein